MKKIKSLFWIGTMALLTLAGCNKQQAKPHVHTYDLEHPEWAWTELTAGGYSATATIECTSCRENKEGHFVVLDANVTHQQTLDPTCTTPGQVTYTAVATYEETELRDTKVVSISDADAHHYVEVVDAQYLKTAATCTEDAVYYKSCEYCGLASTETFVAQGTALGHSKEHLDAKAATCTEDGWIEHWYCRRCGHYFLDEECTQVVTITDVVIPMAHEYEEVVAPEHLKSEATCTEDAVYYKSCKFCHDNGEETFVAQGSALGHDLQHFSPSESTCQVHGNIECWKCVRCGKFFLDEACTQETTEEETWLPFADHDMTHHAGVEATCTEGGTKEYWTCSYEPTVLYKDANGNDKFNNESELDIAPLGHNMTHHDAVAPTCTTEGSLEYWSCDRCEKLFLDENGTQECTAQDLVVPMEEHNYVNSVVTDKIGYFESKCSACGLSNGLTSDLMTFNDVDFTLAQYGAEGGKWGAHGLTAHSMMFEVTDGNTENVISLPKINFSLYKIVKFTLSGNDWSARVGLKAGEYAFPYVYQAEGYSGELKLVTNGNQVNASITCGTNAQNLVITDSDILNGDKSVSLFMIADAAYRTITAELTDLLDTCEHNFVVSGDKLGAKVCSVCGDEIDYVNDLADVDFNQTQYGAEGGKFGPQVIDAHSIKFEALKNEEGIFKLPRINFNAIGFAQFSVTCGSFAIGAGLQSGSYILPYSSVTTDPAQTGVLTLALDANQLVATLICDSTSEQQQIIISDSDIINGNDSVAIYMMCPDYEWQTVAIELTSLSASCEHNYVADPACIGKESCSICHIGRGMATPTFDFTSSLYGAYDVWEGNGSSDPQWVVAGSADSIKFVNAFDDGSIFDYHLPKIYFANFSKVTIDLVINYANEVFALKDDFSASFTAPFSNYDHAQLVFEDITSTSMTVKLTDAYGTAYAQVTCTDVNVLNGTQGFIMFAKGSGSIAYDVLQNFTFVA